MAAVWVGLSRVAEGGEAWSWVGGESLLACSGVRCVLSGGVPPHCVGAGRSGVASVRWESASSPAKGLAVGGASGLLSVVWKRYVVGGSDSCRCTSLSCAASAGAEVKTALHLGRVQRNTPTCWQREWSARWRELGWHSPSR